MSREVSVPKEIQASSKVGKKLDVMDWVVIGGSFGFSYILSYLITEVFFLNFVFIAIFTYSVRLAVLPSVIPKKKNYQVALTVIFKDRTTYKGINRKLED